MNFLAHQHLSFPYSKEMIGNFIGDYVKGKKYRDYEVKIARGIMLHRKIDSFTDQHPITTKCRDLFSASYGKYAGIIVDMVYDYALAYNWSQYATLKLESFTQIIYDNLLKYNEELPFRVQEFLPKMIKAQRLESYANSEGILHAVYLMSQYTSLPNQVEELRKILEIHTETIFSYFSDFYPEIEKYVAQERESLKIF